MFDYMAKYEDMSYFLIVISQSLIDDALNSLKENMKLILDKSDIYKIVRKAYYRNGKKLCDDREYEKQFYLYKKYDDERAYVLVAECIEPCYEIGIKCKSSEMALFYKSLEKQMIETEELEGISICGIDDYPDWQHENSVKNNLKLVGLIN